MAYVGRKRAVVENYDLSGMPASTSVGYVVALAQTLKGPVGVPCYFAAGDLASFIEKMGDTTDLFPGPAMCVRPLSRTAQTSS